MSLTLSSIVRRREGTLSAAVEESLVMLSADSESYISVNAAGRSVLELIEGNMQVEDVCRLLSHDFDASPEDIESDVLLFLDGMAEQGVVEVVRA